MTQMKRKILCIDGGGVKGLFAAKILAELESQIEHPIYHYFDMVAFFVIYGGYILQNIAITYWLSD